MQELTLKAASSINRATGEGWTVTLQQSRSGSRRRRVTVIHHLPAWTMATAWTGDPNTAEAWFYAITKTLSSEWQLEGFPADVG